jgi:hypothetical protein
MSIPAPPITDLHGVTTADSLDPARPRSDTQESDREKGLGGVSDDGDIDGKSEGYGRSSSENSSEVDLVNK